MLPLSLLVFFGAFIPYVGAFVSGLFAVLVALAESGLQTALAVLILILVVQQVEGNVVQPLLMSTAVRLSAFTVIVAIGIGATLLGVLGAFLPVPAAAALARAVLFLRDRDARLGGWTRSTTPTTRRRWLLTAAQRGNDPTAIDRGRADGAAWTTGNLVRPLIDGAAYFRRLRAELADCGAGDQVYLAAWRGDPGQRLDGPGSAVVVELARALSAGASVNGLIWRSHLDRLRRQARSNRDLVKILQVLGGAVVLDQRIRSGGSHHHKFVAIRRPDRPDTDVDVRRRHRSQPQPSRRRRAPRRPAAACDGRGLRRPPCLARRPAGDPRAGGWPTWSTAPGSGGPTPRRPGTCRGHGSMTRCAAAAARPSAVRCRPRCCRRRAAAGSSLGRCGAPPTCV